MDKEIDKYNYLPNNFMIIFPILVSILTWSNFYPKRYGYYFAFL